jgi:hypothetical protein
VEQQAVQTREAAASKNGDIGGKNGQMGASGHICWYVTCYGFMFGFNVSSSPLIFFLSGFLGYFGAKVICQCLDWMQVGFVVDFMMPTTMGFSDVW